jgi:hypothetical protein
VTGLTAKGLDRFSAAMLAIPNQGMHVSIGDPEVQTLLVGTSEALGVLFSSIDTGDVLLLVPDNQGVLIIIAPSSSKAAMKRDLKEAHKKKARRFLAGGHRELD